MTSGYWYKENDYSLEKRKSWLVILICALIVALGTMCWQCGMLNLTWQKVIPYYLSALAGTLMVYSISTVVLKIEKLKKVMVFVGNHTLEILTWHFLSFKLVSLLIIWLYSLPTSRLAEFPVIEEYSYDGWWIAYMVIGMFVPLLSILFRGRRR